MKKQTWLFHSYPQDLLVNVDASVHISIYESQCSFSYLVSITIIWKA